VRDGVSPPIRGGIWEEKGAVMKYSLIMTPTPCRVAGSIISIRPTDSCVRALIITYLLTQNNHVFWRLACDL